MSLTNEYYKYLNSNQEFQKKVLSSTIISPLGAPEILTLEEFKVKVLTDFGFYQKWGRNCSVDLTYEERVKWFFDNYYETGMEYGILLETMKNENLDAIKWYDEIISIPKRKITEE